MKRFIVVKDEVVRYRVALQPQGLEPKPKGQYATWHKALVLLTVNLFMVHYTVTIYDLCPNWGGNTTSFMKENDGLVLYVFFTHPVFMLY